jgi:hypothetical protein
MLNAQAVVSVDAAERLIGQQILLHAKLAEAIDLPLSEDNAVEYLEVFLDYRKHEEQLAFEREKFTAAANAEGAEHDPNTATETSLPRCDVRPDNGPLPLRSNHDPKDP